MKVIKFPQPAEWDELLKRPTKDAADLNETVSAVLNRVRQNGDEAVKEYERLFDKVELSCLAVSEEEMDEADTLIPDNLKAALKLAHENIEKFHASQKFESNKVEVRPGVSCWQKSVPIEKVGLYVPGGTAPLFSCSRRMLHWERSVRRQSSVTR